MTFKFVTPATAGTFITFLGLVACAPETAKTPSSNTSPPSQSTKLLADSIDEPSGALSLGLAIALTLARSPELPSQAWDIRIREAAALQSATRPNPEFSMSLENALGSGSVSGFRGAEETVSVSQTIELGRKRARRMAVAQQDIKLASQAYQLKKAEVVGEVSKAFVELLAAQERFAFTQERAIMAESLAAIQQDLFRLGKISQAERDSGATTVTLAKVEVSSAKSEVEVARKAVSSYWGTSSPGFKVATGNIDLKSSPLPLSEYQKHLNTSAIVRYQSQSTARSKAALEKEQANKSPDVNVGLGARRFQGLDETAAVLEFSLPLPLFDRNTGNIEQARAEVSKSIAEESRILGKLLRQLAVAYAKHSAAYQQASTLEDEAIPSARKNHQNTLAGYRLGKFSYLDVRAARELLLETEQKALDARIRYHQTLIDLETLSGQAL